MYRLNRMLLCVFSLLGAATSSPMERLQTKKQIMRSVTKARKNKVFLNKCMMRFAVEARKNEARRKRTVDDFPSVLGATDWERVNVVNAVVKRTQGVFTRSHYAEVLNQFESFGFKFSSIVPFDAIVLYLARVHSYVMPKFPGTVKHPQGTLDREYRDLYEDLKNKYPLLHNGINPLLHGGIKKYAQLGVDDALMTQFHNSWEPWNRPESIPLETLELFKEHCIKGSNWANFIKFRMISGGGSFSDMRPVGDLVEDEDGARALLASSVAKAQLWTAEPMLHCLQYGQHGYAKIEDIRLKICGFLDKLALDKQRCAALVHATFSHISNSHTG